jgi:hypothetical protein
MSENVSNLKNSVISQLLTGRVEMFPQCRQNEAEFSTIDVHLPLSLVIYIERYDFLAFNKLIAVA